ncbi:sensor histidine kinase [Pseudodonghicola xiamenensis]|uniref:histidine kinase n=1 Tax=Pseudodonghicola xiamenensis TaxID=337702 RepID=A0A8J3MBD0_9RHOB|nr:sensor histidine kinase [Pseudodonghicola xiamenensis]GHG79631.1 sensor histidine kinase [Pseudodonghicola xiamenensis]
MVEFHLPRGLAARVLGAVLLLLLTGGLLVSGSAWLNGRQAARQAYDRILLGAASDIAESTRIQDGRPVVDLPVSAFKLLAQAPEDRVYYAVHGPSGGLVTGLDLAAVVAPRPRSGAAAEYFDAPLQGERARFVQLVRRFAERDFSGEIVVIVGQTLRARRGMALGLVLDALWPMAAAGLALMLLAWVVIRSALRPLKALSADLSHRDPYDLTPMPAESLPSELQVMIESMNRFMGRLDRQVRAMRTLISDSAHQLRTPVAAIRIQAEAALEEPEPESRNRVLARLLARTRSLSTLLDQLLSHALVMHRADSAPRALLDLREIALDIVERRDHEVLAPEVELRLVIGETPVMVWADAFSVGEAAQNLLVNALKHGIGPVTLGVEQCGAEAILWVRDAGHGPDPAIAERLGRRFERSPASGENNVGLGLSIVKAVAAAFDGRIGMQTGELGFQVSLILPSADVKETVE